MSNVITISRFRLQEVIMVILEQDQDLVSRFQRSTGISHGKLCLQWNGLMVSN